MMTPDAAPKTWQEQLDDWDAPRRARHRAYAAALVANGFLEPDADRMAVERVLEEERAAAIATREDRTA